MEIIVELPDGGTIVDEEIVGVILHYLLEWRWSESLLNLFDCDCVVGCASTAEDDVLVITVPVGVVDDVGIAVVEEAYDSTNVVL